MKDKILEWLNHQGYPLEMFVAQQLEICGFSVRQSEYYFDEEGQTNREIDVVGTVRKEIAGTVVRFNVIVECKVTKDKPWIAFTSKSVHLADPARIAQRAGSKTGRSLLMNLCRESEIQQLEIFKVPPRPAYGLTQAFTSGNDVAYNACVSLSKATKGLFRDIDQRNDPRFIDVSLPVIVIDGHLFESFLETDSSIVADEIESSLLVWRNDLVGRPHTFIKVVVKEHFAAAVKEVRDDVEKIFAFVERNQDVLTLDKWMRDLKALGKGQ